MKLPELLNTARLYFNLDLSQYFNEAGLPSPAYLKTLDYKVILEFKLEEFMTIYNEFWYEISKEHKDSDEIPDQKIKKRTGYEIIIDTIYVLTQLNIEYHDLTYQDASYLLYTHRRSKLRESIYNLKSRFKDNQDNVMLEVDTKNLHEMTISQMWKLYDNWDKYLRTRNVR